MKQKIICLGDSLTYGFPYGPQASWVAYAARLSGIDLSNAGVNGNTLEEMAARFDSDVLKAKPAGVIVLGGTNDAFSNDVTLVSAAGALEQMASKALSSKVVPVIGIPVPVDAPSVNAKLERICQEMIALSSRYDLLVLDFRTPFIDGNSGRIREKLYVDGVHPNLEGYKVMGEAAASFFTKSLPKKIKMPSSGYIVC